MKSHLQITFFVLAFFCFNAANGQLTTFDLSKYKTADYQRRLLNFSGSLSGSFANDSYSTESPIESFFSNLNLSYNSIKNTRQKQQELSFGVSLDPYNYNLSYQPGNSEYYKIQTYYRQTDANMFFNSSNRYYFTEKRFWGIDIIGNIDTDIYKQKTDQGFNENVQNQKNFSSGVTIPVRFGSGRLEDVDDARLAVFILQDLQKNQQLSKEISDEDILLFAEKITKLKNKRHFDSRKRRIYDIQALDSFLTDNAFTASKNAVYFSLLMDNWEYANNPWRQSGKRYSFGFAPSIEYSKRYLLSSYRSKSFNKGIELFSEMYISKPLSLKWQRDFRLKGAYIKEGSKNNFSFENDILPDQHKNYISDEVYLVGSFGYGYYPNTRSFFIVTLNSRINKSWLSWSPTDDIQSRGNFAYKLDVSLSGYYYISERLSLNYSFSTGYEKIDLERREPLKFKNIRTSFGVSFAYAIF